jgi:hypothetical protein
MHGRFSNLFRQKALAPTYQYIKGLIPLNLAALYFDPPGLLRLESAGPAFIATKFAINVGIWPYLQDAAPATNTTAYL